MQPIELYEVIRSENCAHKGDSDGKLHELEEDYVAEIVDLLKQNPEKTDVEIAEEYLRAHSRY